MSNGFRQATICVMALGVLLNGARATAQSARPDTYGTAGNIIYNLGPDDFSVSVGNWSNAFLTTNRSILPLNAGSIVLVSPLHLPNGALVTSVTVYYSDTHTSSEPGAALVTSNMNGDNTTPAANIMSFPTFAGGGTSVTHQFATPLQIDNTSKYSMLVQLTRSSTTGEMHILYGVRVNYRLQVSPAPAVATFADVPVGHPLHRFVEALTAAGITGGCGGGNYCPDVAVTRGQMAVFLATALGLHWPN